MSSIVCLASLAGALFSHPGTARQESALPSAEALLERIDAANGDAAARAAAKNVILRGTIRVPGMDKPCTFEELYAMTPEGTPEGTPERVLIRQEYAPPWASTTQGTDGTISWTTDPGFGVSIKEGDEQASVRRLWAIWRSAPWRSLYASASTKGIAERDGRKVYELELRPQHGDSDRWFVDAEKNELVALAIALPDPTGNGILPMEFALTDWKKVDGVRYAHKRVQKIAGMELTYALSAVEHPAELAPELLAPPPAVRAAIADATKRTPAPPADDPEGCGIETLAPQTVASIRAVIPADKVSANLAVLLSEVGRAVVQQGAEPCGPPFSRYHRIDAAKNEIEIEAGIPVKKAIAKSGRVEPGTLPGGRAARTWHLGDYKELPRSYARLEAWMKQQKLAARGPFWEVYWTDPGLEPDARKWHTQILWPVE